MQASSLMSWGRRLQAFGADMRKALSPNFSLDRGVNSSSSVADRPRYDHSTTYVTTGTAGYVTVTLMTFDNQSNARRIEVKSQYCNHSIKGHIQSLQLG